MTEFLPHLNPLKPKSFRATKILISGPWSQDLGVRPSYAENGNEFCHHPRTIRISVPATHHKSQLIHRMHPATKHSIPPNKHTPFKSYSNALQQEDHGQAHASRSHRPGSGSAISRQKDGGPLRENADEKGWRICHNAEDQVDILDDDSGARCVKCYFVGTVPSAEGGWM